jgi:hypothetical protein
MVNLKQTPSLAAETLGIFIVPSPNVTGPGWDRCNAVDCGLQITCPLPA